MVNSLKFQVNVEVWKPTYEIMYTRLAYEMWCVNSK